MQVTIIFIIESDVKSKYLPYIAGTSEILHWILKNINFTVPFTKWYFKKSTLYIYISNSKNKIEEGNKRTVMLIKTKLPTVVGSLI